MVGNGVNRVETVVLEQTQDVTDINLSESLDKTVQTRGTSTTNKKKPKYKR